MQQHHTGPAAPDVGRRCTVKPILNANSTIVEDSSASDGEDPKLRDLAKADGR